MPVLILLLAVPLVLATLLFCGLFALVGLWCPTGFAVFAAYVTFKWRRTHSGGRDYVYLIAYAGALVLEFSLIQMFVHNSWLGMHKIMDGYSGPAPTEALIAIVPVLLYVMALKQFASTPLRAS